MWSQRQENEEDEVLMKRGQGSIRKGGDSKTQRSYKHLLCAKYSWSTGDGVVNKTAKQFCFYGAYGLGMGVADNKSAI